MISPIREDTLEFHHRQLRFMRYPIAFFLFANITCVLHALTLKSGPEQAAPGTQASARPSTPRTVQPVGETAVSVAPPKNDPEDAPQSVNLIAGSAEQENSETEDALSTSADHAAQDRQQWLANLRKRQRDWHASRTRPATGRPKDGEKTSSAKPEDAQPSAERAAESGDDNVTPPEENVRPEELGVTEAKIVVRNPASNASPISFLLNGALTTLKPGEFRDLSAKDDCTVMFHRGGDFGNASVELSAGEYAFSVGNSGWQLRRDDE